MVEGRSEKLLSSLALGDCFAVLGRPVVTGRVSVVSSLALEDGFALLGRAVVTGRVSVLALLSLAEEEEGEAVGKRQPKSPSQSLVVLAFDAEEEGDLVVTGRLDTAVEQSSSSLSHEAFAVVAVDFVKGGFVVERHSSESHVALFVGVALDSDLSLVGSESSLLVVAVAIFDVFVLLLCSAVVELGSCGWNKLENQLSTAF